MSSGIAWVKRSVIVADQAGPMGSLNELEYIYGEIYASREPGSLCLRLTFMEH